MTEYSYYVSIGGTLGADQFNRFSPEAEAILVNMTMGKVNGELNEYQKTKVDNAICNLVDYLYFVSLQDATSNIASESVGDHSVSYREAKTNFEREQEKKKIVQLHLSMTGLLYSALR